MQMVQHLANFRHPGQWNRFILRSCILIILLIVYAFVRAKTGEAPPPALEEVEMLPVQFADAPIPANPEPSEPLYSSAPVPTEALGAPLASLPPTPTPTPFPTIPMGEELQVGNLHITITLVGRAPYLHLGENKLKPRGQWIVTFGRIHNAGDETAYLYPEDFAFSVSSLEGYLFLNKDATGCAGLQSGIPEILTIASGFEVPAGKTVPFVVSFDVPPVTGQATLWIVDARTGIDLGPAEQIAALWHPLPTSTPVPPSAEAQPAGQRILTRTSADLPPAAAAPAPETSPYAPEPNAWSEEPPEEFTASELQDIPLSPPPPDFYEPPFTPRFRFPDTPYFYPQPWMPHPSFYGPYRDHFNYGPLPPHPERFRYKSFAPYAWPERDRYSRYRRP